MTVALVSSAELTLLLPYITPPIVLFFFQLFGEKSQVCTLKVNAFMCSGGREGARHRSHIKETA